jgi:hypothetical protein
MSWTHYTRMRGMGIKRESTVITSD